MGSEDRAVADSRQLRLPHRQRGEALDRDPGAPRAGRNWSASDASFALSRDGGDELTSLTADQAQLEVARLVGQDQSRPRPCTSFAKVAGAAIHAPDNVAMTQSQRMYDDSSELRLTQNQHEIDLDSYVAHLSRGTQGQRAFGLAGGQTIEDTLDARPPSVSDLSGYVSPDSQDYTGSTEFSDKAQEELDSLPPVYKSSITADLASADDADEVGHKSYFTSRARDTAHVAGRSRLAAELGTRVRALSGAASTVPDPESADDQSAGTMSAAQVAAEVARISQMNTIGYNSNVSTPPKSLAQKNREQVAARPGYSNPPMLPIRA